MVPLLVASIASSLPSVVSAGEKLLEKASPKVSSALNAIQQAQKATGSQATHFDQQLQAPEQCHKKPISLEKYLKAQGLHNQEMLKEHTFHLEHQLKSHPDLANWLQTLPNHQHLELGYTDKGQLTIQTESGLYREINPETPLGELASRVLELRTLEKLSNSTAGIPISRLAQTSAHLRQPGFFQLV